MSLNEDICVRLDHWKFKSAKKYLDDEVTERERLTIEALADSYGNCDQIDGTTGMIVTAAIEALIGGLINAQSLFSWNSHVDIAKLFHDEYERLAPKFGYITREASAVPWESVPEKNRELMIAVVEAVENKAMMGEETRARRK